ncbi:MAG: DUF1727 domain-containing protein, partial [Clostridiaceae bacterium]|nr:DUF1727 domain-containing protein [Clostridiaceae bacterium]
IAVSRVLDALCHIPGKKQFILLVDTSLEKMSEEDNTAWLYDTELSLLAAHDVTRLVVGGRRCRDIRNALLFAGVPAEKIRCSRDKSEAASLIKEEDGPETIGILYELYSEPVSRKVALALEEMFGRNAEEKKESGHES